MEINGEFLQTSSTTRKPVFTKDIESLAKLIENLPVAVYTCDAQGFLTNYNAAAVELWGRTPQIGTDLWCGSMKAYSMDGTPIALVDTPMALTLKLEKSVTGRELIIERPDGTRRTIKPFTQPLLNDKGIVTGGLCVVIDITEQKQVEDDIKVSESRYGHLVNSLPLAVYTVDQHGNINYFNHVAETLWGYTPKIKESVVKFCACYKVWTLDGEFLPPDKTPMATALQTGQSFRNVEAIVERPDGSKFYTNVNIDPLFDCNKNIVGAINIFQDITAKKQAELALSQSQQNYEQLIHSLSSAVYTTDAAGYVKLFNQAAVDLWGRAPEVGKDLWCGSWKIFKTSGEPLPLDSCPMAVALKEQRPVFGAEIVVERPDGVRRHVAPNPRPLFDVDGKVIGAVNMLIDITEQVKAKETLERTVEERTKELRTANEALAKSNLELEQFAYITSHDLQEPLRKIQTFSTFIERKPDDETHIKKYLSKINAAAARMSGLIRDLLNYSRITVNQSGEKVVDLEDLLTKIKTDFELIIEEKNAVFHIDPLPKVKCIEHQMQQLFSNLIHNSLKFTNGHNPEIRIKASKLTEDEAYSRYNLNSGKRYYAVEVVDNGIGFEPHYAEKMFTLFHRLNPRDAYEGTGIGLAICKKIVDTHKGVITATGQLGVGACFTVVLPVE
jgi:PAS domain S-box-containing protein